MAVLHPFPAFKPSPEDVQEVASVPYDVISAEEARLKAKGNPKSFLHIIRPEIDLPEDTAFNDDAVYEQGANNLHKFIEQGILKKDDQKAVYIYRLTWEGKTQTGIFGCVSVEDYNDHTILKHELTRPDKEDDRTRHILTQSAHAEPVMMTFKDSERVNVLIKETIAENDVLFDFTADDGVQHTLWKLQNPRPFVDAFSDIKKLYIADGHHRCKSASRAAEDMKKENDSHTGDEEYNYFPAVLFPMGDMNILPYNRIVHTVTDDFDKKIKKEFELTETDSPTPSNKGEVCLYRNRQWKKLELPLADSPNSVEKLDAYRLQSYVLEPLLGIEDPRTDKNLSFVGGIRGTRELENLVDSGNADLAVSMYPTSIEELVEVSDEGKLMPPKSTWFEPKLRSGLLVHTF